MRGDGRLRVLGHDRGYAVRVVGAAGGHHHALRREIVRLHDADLVQADQPHDLIARRRCVNLGLALGVGESDRPRLVEQRVGIVVEECDSLAMKVVVRQGARVRRIPVLMASSDRGLVDVERFDLEPQRQILHGLLGELDVALLPGMSSREKVPHMLRSLEAEQLSPRMAASVVEIDRTLSTWPQLAGDVVLGATAIAEVVRRIGLGEDLRSDLPTRGRVRVEAPSPGLEPELSEPKSDVLPITPRRTTHQRRVVPLAVGRPPGPAARTDAFVRL